jgi:hypothetical protein
MGAAIRLMRSKPTEAAHAQHVSAALIIALRSSIWDKGEFAIQETHGNLETLGTAQQNQYR